MLFKAPVLAAIAEGKVDLAFRRWRKPTVKAGGTLTTPVGVLAIDAIAVVGPETISDADAIRAGYADAAAALAALGPSPRTPDQVAAATGLPMPRVQTALFELELTGAAAAQPGHTYIAVR